MSRTAFFMSRSRNSQQGAALVETSLILLPMLLAACLAIEVSQSNQIRHITALALYQTSVTASLTHADRSTWQARFERAILPLFVTSGLAEDALRRLRTTQQELLSRTGLPVWNIEVISPTTESFEDFAHPALSAQHGVAVIRNDYLAEQHMKNQEAGWEAGRGPHSGQTIYEANTLQLRLTYLYPPKVPGVGAVLRILGQLGRNRKDRAGQAWQHGLFAVVLEQGMMMQSHPIAWHAGFTKQALETQRSIQRQRSSDTDSSGTTDSARKFAHERHVLAGVELRAFRPSVHGVAASTASAAVNVGAGGTGSNAVTAGSAITAVTERTPIATAPVSSGVHSQTTDTNHDIQKEQEPTQVPAIDPELCGGLLCCQ